MIINYIKVTCYYGKTCYNKTVAIAIYKDIFNTLTFICQLQTTTILAAVMCGVTIIIIIIISDVHC